MSMALPDDVANEVVDVTQFAAMLRGTRKPIVVSSPFGGDTLHAMHEMAAACGEAASFACLAMSSPPLMLDDVACSKALACAELEIPLVLATSVSAGGQGPVSHAACVAVADAEILACLVVHQLGARRSALHHGRGHRRDEHADGGRGLQLAGRLPRQPGTARRAALVRAPELALRQATPTARASTSSGPSRSASPPSSARCRVATLLHDVGYLESGMQSALEALVLGDEVAGYARAFLGEVRVDDEALALAEIEAVGPGGTHLGTKMTRRHHRDFWRASLIDQSTYERWSAAGSPTLLERVRARLAEIRAAGPAFTLDDETQRTLDRLSSGG